MVNKLILGIWGILLLIASLSMYIMVHESVHAVRIEMPQMMCIGLSDEYFGTVTHNNFYSESARFKEEVIANIVASIFILLFYFFTYYIIAKKYEKGGEVNG